jgi:hypothetical protein
MACSITPLRLKRLLLLLLLLLLLQVLNDSYRTNFYSGYINSACEAIKKYKLNVPMIFAWSL